MHERIAQGYSLWLRPSAEMYSLCSEKIREFTKRYSTHSFEPHATLLGGIMNGEEDAAEKTEGLAGSIGALQSKVIGFGDVEDTMAFTLRLEKNEGLAAAGEMARRVFGMENKEFMPHISLVYYDLSSSEREVLKDRVGGLLGKSFMFDRLTLYSTEGTVDRWHEIKGFRLERL